MRHLVAVAIVCLAGCSLPIPREGQRYELEVEFNEPGKDTQTAWETTSANVVKIAELVAAIQSPPIVAVVVASKLVELAQMTGALGVEAVRNAKRVRRVIEPAPRPALAIGPDLSVGMDAGGRR